MQLNLRSRYNGRASSLSLYANTLNITKKMGLCKSLPPRPIDPITVIPSAPSPPPAAQNANEPIVDEDIPFTPNSTFIPEDQAPHVDIVFPTTQPLPDIDCPRFYDEFTVKANMCCQLCDFRKPEYDKEAKQTKLKVIQEIASTLNNLKVGQKIPFFVFEKIVEIFCSNVFRRLPIVDNKVFIIGVETSIDEPAMMHLEPIYTLMIKLFAFEPPFSGLFPTDFVQRLFQMFNSPSFVERDYLAHVLSAYYVTYTQCREKIMNSIIYLLIDHLNNEGCPFSVSPTILFVYYIFKAVGAQDNAMIFQVFQNSIIRLLSSNYFRFFSSQFFLLTNTLISFSSRIASPLIRAVLTLWPETNVIKQNTFLELLNLLIEKCSSKDFQEYCKPTFKLYAKCANSGSSKVTETSLLIWKNSKIMPKLIENSKTIYPIVYPAFVQCSRDHWCEGIRNKVIFVLKSMHEIDPFLYEDLSTKSNNKKKDLEQQKTWAQIARAATRTDHDVNLATTLSRIQLTFNTGVPIAACSLSLGMTAARQPKIIQPQVKWR